MNRKHFTKLIGIGALSLNTSLSFASTNLFTELRTTRIPLGICNHSLRTMKLNVKQLIEYATNHQLDSVLVNSLPVFKSLDNAHLLNLKAQADKNNISLYIGAGSISENSTSFKDTYGTAKELLLEGIRVAKLLGSPIVACRIGSIKDRYQDGGIKRHMAEVIEVMQSVREHVLEAGVKLAIENHAGDLRADEILEVVKKTGTDICGILYDPANAVWVLEDPMETLELLKKHILCTSIRDVIVWKTENGAKYQCKAIGEGVMDYKKFAKILAKSCPGVPLHVESISNFNIDLPFKTTAFMKGFPNVSKDEIKKISRFASRRESQEVLNPENEASKKVFEISMQQKELQRSIDYLRANCNAGLK